MRTLCLDKWVARIAAGTLGLLLCSATVAQKVGVVLSGGGAAGFAHIGVLKALEDHGIPIDYIVGTSSGALVGGLYASGFSPREMEKLVLSPSFQSLSRGEVEDAFTYTIEDQADDAGMFTLRFALAPALQKGLHTHLINSTPIDLELMYLLGRNPPVAHQNYDSLYVPFRCIASDVVAKQSVVFRSGKLNQSVRASIAYPFFISPVEIDGELLFDGGLYNNFPLEDMYREFSPDVIIGSNVSKSVPPPSSGDLTSQLFNMLTLQSNHSPPCEATVLIEPQSDAIGTFKFRKVQEAIELGYASAVSKIDSIKKHVTVRHTKAAREEKRRHYRSKHIDINISKFDFKGASPEQTNYIRKKLVNAKKEKGLHYEQLKRRYLNVYQSEPIHQLFPLLQPLTDTTQLLRLKVEKEKPFKVSFGGHYSSRPFNTGFLSLAYSNFKWLPLTLHANAYFGNFYGSVRAGLRLSLPTRRGSYLEPTFVMNRWNYTQSFSTFFEDVASSYIVQNEAFWRMSFHHAVGNKGRLTLDFTGGKLEDDYYQTGDFSITDTADYTRFRVHSPGVTLSLSNLNRKQFASAGYHFLLKGRWISGTETTVLGSASVHDHFPVPRTRNWAFLKLHYSNYFVKRKIYRLGAMAEGVASNQPHFDNYTASLLSAQSFQPTPDAHLGFFDRFRANYYIGAGCMNVFTVNDQIDVRLEGYLFQPIVGIPPSGGDAVSTLSFNRPSGIISTSFIYHSPIGPVRTTLNYTSSALDQSSGTETLILQLSFGYVMFNRRAIR